MSTSPVMTVTDELLAELEEAAKNACSYGKDDWFKLDDLRHDIELDDAKYVATSSPFVIVALTAELRRLRAENADLAKDAGRYRWMRDGAGYCDTRDIPGMAPLRMDEYIDTAMERPQ